jgi:Cu/Ag efflux protein CusF
MHTRLALALALGLVALPAAAAQRQVSASRTETLTATVKSVDTKTRDVVLIGKDGAEMAFKASDQIKNLEQLKAHDKVSVTFDQALTLWILGENDPAPELSVGADVTRAAKGAKPGGLMTADVVGTATVEKIAADKSSVTLKGPRGNSVTLAVRNAENLDGVVVGTKVGFAYSETLAVDVKPGKAPAKKDAAKKDASKDAKKEPAKTEAAPAKK